LYALVALGFYFFVKKGSKESEKEEKASID